MPAALAPAVASFDQPAEEPAPEVIAAPAFPLEVPSADIGMADGSYGLDELCVDVTTPVRVPVGDADSIRAIWTRRASRNASTGDHRVLRIAAAAAAAMPRIASVRAMRCL